MIDFDTVIRILGDTMFDGNIGIGGTVVLVVILAVVMAITRKALTTLVLAIPLIMIFAVMGYLPSEIGIMMLVVVALGIAMESRGVFS